MTTTCNFSICQLIETKLGTVIELCISYPKTKELVLLNYANGLMTSFICSQALKGIEIQTTVNCHFQTYYAKICHVNRQV